MLIAWFLRRVFRMRRDSRQLASYRPIPAARSAVGTRRSLAARRVDVDRQVIFYFVILYSPVKGVCHCFIAICLLFMLDCEQPERYGSPV